MWGHVVSGHSIIWDYILYINIFEKSELNGDKGANCDNFVQSNAVPKCSNP